MTQSEISRARADIESTQNLLERTLKLVGLLTTLFKEHGISLVVVGGSSVEFYTEGGYMSGDLDLCRLSLKSPSPRLIRDILSNLGGKCLGRNWQVCGIFVDILGVLECETAKDLSELETPYGKIRIIPPEIVLVERIFYAQDSVECVASARQMMTAALSNPSFDWQEAERLASLPDFDVLDEMEKLKKEMQK